MIINFKTCIAGLNFRAGCTTDCEGGIRGNLEQHLLRILLIRLDK